MSTSETSLSGPLSRTEPLVAMSRERRPTWTVGVHRSLVGLGMACAHHGWRLLFERG
jgi:hypothetical protein